MRAPAKSMAAKKQALPCRAYLRLNIMTIRAHKEYMYHGDKALLELDVRIDDVFRDGRESPNPWHDTLIRKGRTITFILDTPTPLGTWKDNPELLIGKNIIWGIDYWNIDKENGFYHLEKICEPFGHDKITDTDIKQFRSQFHSVPLPMQ